MLSYAEQFQQDVEIITAGIIETYLQIQDHCRWHRWDQALQLLEHMSRQVQGLETYIAVMGGQE